MDSRWLVLVLHVMLLLLLLLLRLLLISLSRIRPLVRQVDMVGLGQAKIFLIAVGVATVRHVLRLTIRYLLERVLLLLMLVMRRGRLGIRQHRRRRKRHPVLYEAVNLLLLGRVTVDLARTAFAVVLIATVAFAGAAVLAVP